MQEGKIEMKAEKGKSGPKKAFSPEILGNPIYQSFLQHKKMYDVAGFLPITEDDIGRYVDSNIKLLKKLPDLIHEGLNSDNDDVRIGIVQTIEYAPEEMRERFVAQGLGDSSSYVRESAISMIQHLPEMVRARYIKQGLEDADKYARSLAVRMVQFAPEEAQTKLRDIVSEFISQGLGDSDKFVRGDVVPMIQYAPEGMKEKFIGQGFKDIDASVRRAAILMVQYISEESREKLIKQGLEDVDWDVRLFAAHMIQYAPKEAQAKLRESVSGLIDRDFGSVNESVRRDIIHMIEFAPEGSREKLIDRGLGDSDEYVRRYVVSTIQYAPEETRERLVGRGLHDADRQVRSIAIGMIWCVPKAAWARLYKQITPDFGGDLAKIANETPLYQGAGERFVRREFNKTGSGTTLLDIVPGQEDATLKEKIIARHINFSAYMNWKRAFEATQFWKDMGFDYVPIEPIVRVIRDKSPEKVIVFSKVLGSSVANWEKTGMFQGEINDRVESIKKALISLGIEHGHTHDDNFCLVFDRTGTGEIDLSKPPRVYVIDLDEARSDQVLK